jgi:hypothetical protein
MKYLFLGSLLMMQLMTTAQNDSKVAANNEMIIAFNAEQMIEKVGFENLMSTFLDKGIFKKSYNSTENNIAIRKSLAALYGSGIDFKRKFWFSNTQKFGNSISRYTEDFSKIFFMVPVANKGVFQENVLNIINKNRTNDEKISFITSNNLTYCKDRNNIFILTDKDFISHKIPYFYEYTNTNYNGKIIKQDTIVIPKSERFNYDYNEPTSYEIEANKNKKIIEVDKVMDNGKIVRLLKKEKNTATLKTAKVKQAPYADEATTVAGEAAKEAYPAPLMDTTAMAVETIYGVRDSATKVIDTLMNTDYVNDSIRVNIYYIPYTDEQRDSVTKANETAREIKQQTYIDNLLKNVEQLKVYDRSDSDTKKIKETKEDIAMISTSSIPNIGGSGSVIGLFFGTGLTRGIGSTEPSEASSYLSFINFENGKAVLKSQTSCCNNNNKFVNEMYLPVSNFWPKEAQKNAVGFMHMNINLPLVLNYFATAMGEKVGFDKELKKQGVERADFENAFTGEVVMNMTIGKKVSSNRSEPKFFAAIKLKDAKKAVVIMNKLASNDLKTTSNYQFDENGEYIMIYSKNRILSKTVQKVDSLILPTGTFGTMRLNVLDIVNAFLNDGERRKDTRMNTAIKTFFGNLNIVNNKTEEGNFIGEGTFDMGPKDKNALVNLFSFINDMYKHNEDIKYEETIKAEKHNEDVEKRRKADKLKNEMQKRKISKKH